MPHCAFYPNNAHKARRIRLDAHDIMGGNGILYHHGFKTLLEKAGLSGLTLHALRH